MLAPVRVLRTGACVCHAGEPFPTVAYRDSDHGFQHSSAIGPCLPILQDHPDRVRAFMTMPEKQLPHSETPIGSSASQISMRSELQRKMIHLCSISIPIAYIWLPRETMLAMFVPLSIFSFIVEFMRIRVPAVRRLIDRMFGSMLRTHEKASEYAKLSGATYVVLSAVLCVFIFPKVICIAGFAVLIISDTASALFGRRFGRHRFLEKSVEGSSAFVVTAVMVVLAVAWVFAAPGVFIAVGVVASVVAAVAEAMSYGVNVDDNLSIPLAFGFSMWGLLALFGGPAVDALLALR